MNYGFNKNIVCILGQKRRVKGIATVLAGLVAAKSRKQKQKGPNTLLYMGHGRTVNSEILANRCALYGCLKESSHPNPKCEGLC